MPAITPVPMSLTAIVVAAESTEAPLLLTSVLDLRLTRPDAGPGVVTAAADFFGNGGGAALVVTVRDQAGAVEALTGWQDGSGQAVRLVALEPGMSADGVAELESWCETAGALLVLDADHEGTVPAGAGRNAAVYYPPLVDEHGTSRPAAPAMAGLMARTTAALGPWTAPAGRSHPLLGAHGLAEDLNTPQTEVLTASGVNVLRVFPGDSRPVPWGARTAAAESEWRYVPVRRLATFIEASVDAGCRWVASEPNDATTWAQVREAVEELLAGLRRLGALVGGRPDEAFFVRCDRSTMTQADLDDGLLVCEIGFAPVRPAEFVMLRSRWTTAGRGEPDPPP